MNLTVRDLGRAEGREEGRRLGQAELLVALSEAKFGAAPAGLHDRLAALTEHHARANGLADFRTVLSADLNELPAGGFDAVLANPPYYANSEVARLFIRSARRVLKRRGKFYLVTKMPVQTIPEVVDTFGSVESVDNRGYTVIVGTA